METVDEEVTAAGLDFMERAHKASARAALVRRAVEISNQACGRVSVSELCRRLRVSQRALHYAFVAQVGMSPCSYLKIRRMNQTRRQLRRTDPQETTVGDLAARFGFFEHGRFAVEYRQMFGESPSETLKCGPR